MNLLKWAKKSLRLKAISSKTNKHVIKRTVVDVLRMQDVLFHTNSAVVLPSNPEEQGAKDNEKKLSGVRGLAMVFRHFQTDPDRGIVIFGHTDKSGATPYNFELSRLRAQSVLYLLTGERDSWAEVAAQRQVTRDIKFILAHYAGRFACSPGAVDDTWENETLEASRKLAAAHGQYEYRTFDLPPDVLGHMQKHKNWPVGMWKAVYDLYEQDLILAVTGKNMQRGVFAPIRNSVKHVAGLKNRWVACGPSVPQDETASEQKNQKDRRVEILFYKKDCWPRIAEDFNDCPAGTAQAHPKAECPLRNKLFYKYADVDLEKYATAEYHLSFVYYDRIHKAVKRVPGGLVFDAFNDDAYFMTTTSCENGVFTLEVQGFKNSPREPKVRFFAKTAEQLYVYTKDDATDPKIVSRTELEEQLKKERDALPEDKKAGAPSTFDQMPFDRRVHYYDLPMRWDSRNWHCKFGDDVKLFADHVKETTSAAKPLVFCLDDVVLTDRDLRQDRIQDQDADEGSAQSEFDLKRQRGKPQPFSDKSRARLLCFDHTEKRLELYGSKPAGTKQEKHDGSIIRFAKGADGKQKNLICCPPIALRTVVFCGEFYDVSNKRTADSNHTKADDGHLIGARAAVRNDDLIHYGKTFRHDDETRTVHSPGIGDFDAHYLHDCGAVDGTTYAALIIYWWTFVLKDTKPTVGSADPDEQPATNGQVREFLSIGMENAMERWNKKHYQMADHAGKTDLVIQPLFLFEANETLAFTPDTPVEFYNDQGRCPLLAVEKFKNALKTARGGRPMSLSFIVEEDKGSWVRSWTGTGEPFSLASLRIKTRQDDNARFAGFPFDDFGTSHGCLVIAHELGHATGQVDDYIQTVSQSGALTKTRVPTFGQFGHDSGYNRIQSNNANFGTRISGSDSYSVYHDERSIMVLNGPIRMRHVWRFVQWVNDLSKSGKALHALLKGRQFELQFKYTDSTNTQHTLEYFRDIHMREDPWMFAPHRLVAIDNPNNKKVHAFLYRNLDETGILRRTAPSTDLHFKALLVVRPLLHIEFVSGATNWTVAQGRNWVARLDSRLSSDNPLGIRNRFYLAGGGGATDPTLIYFKFGFDFRGHANALAAANYIVQVTHDTNDAIAYDKNTKTITLGRNLADWDTKLVNFFFNKNQADASFAAADLGFLRDWFNTTIRLGNTIHAL